MKINRKTISLIWSLLLTVGCAASNPKPATRPTSMVEPTNKPAPTAVSTTPPVANGTETIVFLRHAEKPALGLGQLTPQGLNRALALANVLPAKYGRPDYIFAPNPDATHVSEGGSVYFYVRPLATIEPTAIVLGMPVRTPFGFAEIDKLNAELTDPKYARSMIFIAWEHGKEYKSVANLIKQFGGDPKQVPPWHGKDYDSLYVVRIIRTAGQPTKATFTLDHENLDHMSTTLPTVPPATEPTSQPGGNPSLNSATDRAPKKHG